MRESSPPKVFFNYGHQQLLQRSQAYSPNVHQSGYILGEPITYNNVGQLPNNLHSYSPSRPRASTDFITSSRIGEYEAPDPSRFAPPPNRNAYRQYSPPRLPPSPPKLASPPRTKTYSEYEYNQLLSRYNALELRYKALQDRYL